MAGQGAAVRPLGLSRLFRVEFSVVRPKALLAPGPGLLRVILVVHGVFGVHLDQNAAVYAWGIMALAAVGAEGKLVGVPVVRRREPRAAVGA